MNLNLFGSNDGSLYATHADNRSRRNFRDKMSRLPDNQRIIGVDLAFKLAINANSPVKI